MLTLIHPRSFRHMHHPNRGVSGEYEIAFNLIPSDAVISMLDSHEKMPVD